MAQRIKKGSEVIVISGNDKGRKGVVLSIDLRASRALVSGVNLCKRHVKPTKDSEGGIIVKEAWIHLSNLSLPERTKVASRES
jgi:large subunit ribosomal protein L24